MALSCQAHNRDDDGHEVEEPKITCFRDGVAGAGHATVPYSHCFATEPDENNGPRSDIARRSVAKLSG